MQVTELQIQLRELFADTVFSFTSSGELASRAL